MVETRRGSSSAKRPRPPAASHPPSKRSKGEASKNGAFCVGEPAAPPVADSVDGRALFDEGALKNSGGCDAHAADEGGSDAPASSTPLVAEKELIMVPSIDLISQLPEELLVHILSFLQLHDAIKTSALSKEWNHVWKLIPTLHFSGNQLSYKLVNQVLAQHRASKLTSVLFTDVEYCQDLSPIYDTWIACALDRNVERLTLNFNDSELYEYGGPSRLPSCLFQSSSTSLTQLHLSCCSLTSLPNSHFCFRSLKFMRFYIVNTTAPLLERLTSSRCCPALEKLDLDRCFEYKDNGRDQQLRVYITNPSLKCVRVCFDNGLCGEWMEICAPHVSHLEIFGHWMPHGYKLKDLFSLKEATIGVHSCSPLWREDRPLLVMNNLLSSLRPQKLNIYPSILQILPSICKHGRLTASVQAKHLHVSVRLDGYHIPGLALLCNSSPLIEHLTISFSSKVINPILLQLLIHDGLVGDTDMGDKNWMLLDDSFQFKILSIVELEGFFGGGTSHVGSASHCDLFLEVVKVVLNRSEKLKKMVIRNTDTSKQHGIPSQVKEQCLSFPKSSPDAVIEFC